ncbi:MAG: hypothetical protein EZS28_025240 [Streblomastix strix]|uniref:Uncharacterized protein n=1 Tax=Streblomastix strix TaxID=222440 RepID=A0A5J4V9P8_9EUKA|nr:MAG: hypothetical protein EZS28_025240 [Streblomastix strix]
MESEERIAKFFIGPDLGELVGVGISGVPNEIKAVVLSSGALKAFQAFNTKRIGDSITSLTRWSAQDGKASFFIGSNFDEQVGIETTEVPNDVKLAILSSKPFKVYEINNAQRISDQYNAQVSWNIQSDRKLTDSLQIDSSGLRKEEKQLEIQKLQGNDNQTLTIDCDKIQIRTIQINAVDFNFNGVVSKTSAQLHTVDAGGIAIVRESEEIPQTISFNDMIKLKGVVFSLPQFALYMNGVQIWKRSDDTDISSTSYSSSSTQQPSSQSISSIQPPPKWTTLSVQLDFETDIGIAKFIIGSEFSEFANVGISDIPHDIKVVILSFSAFRVYQPVKSQRIGESITQLSRWSV